jgi:chromosome segregation ATPase
LSTVNHPPHYHPGKHEVIDVIEAWGLGFSLGNAVKYIARHSLKDDAVTNLRKARWYIERHLANLGDVAPAEPNRFESTDAIANARLDAKVARDELATARVTIESLTQQINERDQRSDRLSRDAGLAGHTAQLEASLRAAQETIRDREAEAAGLQQAVAAAKTERDAARRSLAEAQHEVEAARKIHAEHKHDDGIHAEVLQLRRRLSRGLQIIDSLGTKDTPAMVDLRKVLVGP